ncbi:ABC transporter ATP-binding protein [Chengkuizengella marina]|uniref:ABC transporter ATP-binding protein n=1 Tax=Chengkuizengella marina TaxID=2507566 RepID=A0A6N9Q2W1_9BACL|nr:ABC transporter ATP-binding protein [Chengkuizengella marina]NBI29124.1 ABC transporter ATP-binding protein [Chengkuizengella marina]
MSPFKTYFQFVKPYWKLIFITIIIGVIKFGIPLTLPLMMQYVIDGLLTNDEMAVNEKVSKLVYLLVGALILFIIVRWPIEYLRQYFAQLATSRILFDIRNRLFDHIQKLSIRFYQNRKVGEIISRFINDVEQTKSIVEVGLMNIWLDLFTLTIALGFMFYLNPILALIAISIFPLYAIAVKILYKRLKQLTKDRSQALAEIQAYLHERIQGIPVIRSFTLEKVERDRFGKRNSIYLDKALKQTRWNALTHSIINTLTDIAPLLVIGYGGYQVIQGNLTLGAFVAFFGYLDRLYSPLRRLVNSSTVLTQAAASLERMVEFMEEPYDIVDAPHAYPIRNVKGDIQFDHVTFSYLKDGEPILKDIQFSIRSGETVALVGMSGGGKSSLVGLIPRFFDINQGVIRIDGHDITNIQTKSLRENIGMVQQDNILFSGSVRENILFGKPDATEEEMIQAAKAANAHDFILELPNKYDTEIGERGVKLSGGQKQRVAISRVFLKDPQILILDEATSALDLESEALIQKSLDRLAKDRTTLIVAHRLSTITHADKIVYMEDGQIKEMGTHQQLMKTGGGYARLYNVQNLTSDSPVKTTNY